MTILLSGRWWLLPVDVPDDQIDQHRVDLVFHDDPKGLRGAVLGRDGSEVPLQSVAFEGTELRLHMPRHPKAATANVPFLLLNVVGDHFEGGWSAAAVQHLRLKLVRARE